MRIKEGDTVVVKEKHYGWEPYSIGDVFTVRSVEPDETGDDGWDVLLMEGHSINYMMFASEVERIDAPKDYDENEAAADDADVSQWVAPEDAEMYRNIVTSLSEAIADKAAQMRGEDEDGDIPAASMSIQIDGRTIAQNAVISGNDIVKAPSHYVNSGIEPIQYMADKLPSYDDGHTAFCVGNVIKYVSRAPHKGKLVEDLKKARQYLDFAIEHEEKKRK